MRAKDPNRRNDAGPLYHPVGPPESRAPIFTETESPRGHVGADTGRSCLTKKDAAPAREAPSPILRMEAGDLSMFGISYCTRSHGGYIVPSLGQAASPMALSSVYQHIAVHLRGSDEGSHYICRWILHRPAPVVMVLV